MSMLSRVEPLTLETLNHATQAWSEMEYNRNRHREINCTPVDKLLDGPDSSRPTPDSEKMTFAFTKLYEYIGTPGEKTCLGIRLQKFHRF